MVATTSYCCSRLMTPIDANPIPQQSIPKFHAFRCHSYDPRPFHPWRLCLSLAPARSKSSSEAEPSEPSAAEGDEWLVKLPEKISSLYAHSLFCIEAWLRRLGFRQSKEDRAIWLVELPEWHARLSLDITDLYVRQCYFAHHSRFFETRFWLLNRRRILSFGDSLLLCFASLFDEESDDPFEYYVCGKSAYRNPQGSVLVKLLDKHA